MIKVVVGDITKMPVDVIVNAANPALVRGGGVCGAIFRAAGEELDEFMARSFPMGCHTGEVALSVGFNIPVSYIAHAVGPDMRTHSGRKCGASLLASVYWNCLDLADKVLATSIAFPAISTGIYGFPFDEASSIAARVITQWLAVHKDSTLTDVVLVAYDNLPAEVLQNAVAMFTSEP